MSHTFSARFIVLDGVEGCGKSTQTRLLGEAFAARGCPVVLTQEPGGTSLGAKLRELLLHGEAQMSALTETFLFCADRAEHVQSMIVPALAAGSTVISDRFSASTFAYQVWAGEVPTEVFEALDGTARSGLAQAPGRHGKLLHPDLTIILDVDPETGRARKAAPGEAQEDNFERRSPAYHARVREGFLHYAKSLGAAALVLDAAQRVEALHQEILLATGLSG
jgi:dTMP kinase